VGQDEEREVKIRLGVAMPLKGGRPAIIAAEVLEARDPTGRLVHGFDVGAVERVTPYSVEAAKARIVAMTTAAKEHLPCVIIDVGSPQGLALHQSMRTGWDRDLHRPHAYPGTGMRGPLFSTFLQAYSAGLVTFQPGLDARSALDRALVFYMGGGVAKSGVELSSEDEALVVALGLAMTWPKHGGAARALREAVS
jgi:hypothetical protein